MNEAKFQPVYHCPPNLNNLTGTFLFGLMGGYFLHNTLTAENMSVGTLLIGLGFVGFALYCLKRCATETGWDFEPESGKFRVWQRIFGKLNEKIYARSELRSIEICKWTQKNKKKREREDGSYSEYTVIETRFRIDVVAEKKIKGQVFKSLEEARQSASKLAERLKLPVEETFESDDNQ